MFTGIGGFELGIQRAFNHEHAYFSEESEQEERSQGRVGTIDKPRVLLHVGDGATPLCVGYSEIDKYAISTYERHYEHTNYGSATDINPADLPDFNLLVGGFPCQAFSVAGKRLGFNETRGTLFFDIARILAEKRPGHLVLENVKGLLTHEQGKTFQTILGVLADLGYRVEWQVLNSKDFGVPQNRERVYIVGHLGDGCGREVFPITGTNGKDIVQLNKPKYSHERLYAEEGLSPTLNTMQGGDRQPKIVAAVLTPDRPEKRQNGRRIKEHNEPSFTVTAQDKHGVQIDTCIRRLTPKECERLQGFPDDWTAGVSDTQRYKQCGNAVTVNVVEAVAKGLLPCLES
jgi:DNA (cytosine-5)-methyltransferase 1